MMKVEKDFEDFVKLLNKNKVKYVIVGSFASAFHSEPRNTGDIDFFIENSHTNSLRIINCLKEFGFESIGINATDLKEKDSIIQLGFSPNRIDLITSISGVTFQTAYKNKVSGKFGKTTTNFISINNLIKNKKLTGRKKDIADVELLEKYKKVK